MPYLGKQPARVPVTADDIPANSIDASKIVDGAITIADIADDAVTEDKLANAINTAIAANTAKVTNATHSGEVTGATALTITADAVTGAKIADNAIDSEHYADGSIDTAHIAADQITGALIADDQINSEHIASGAVDDAHLATGITASKLTGALPAIDGSSLTGITTDTTTIENNIALLGFFRASDNSVSKYSLVDQVVDEYVDATGVDAGNSTNEALTSGVYRGETSSVGNATGGTITTVSGYKYHAFHNTASNTQTSTNFVTPSTGTIDYLIVGAGGSGRSLHTGTIGSGHPGAHQYFSGQSKAAGTYAIVVAGMAPGWTTSTNGLSSSAFGTTKAGGVLGTHRTSGAGVAGTTYSAFSQFGVSGVFGGGGGAMNAAGGSGGGGQGGNYGGDPNGHVGVNSTGGGGGSGNSGANASGGGGSGVVLIRYLTDAFTTTAVGDLTLQSVATTAESAPTTGDIVMLIEDAAGTATINTDIKAYISRDGSAFSSQVTLTDEGDWGTNKRILAAHDVDISGITSGTAMKYKITTHNQSASKETKIHATSLAWA